MSIEDTSRRDPLVHLMGAMGGFGGYVEGMEAAGQAQVVHSDKLPTKAPWVELEALGFVPGEPVAGDDLFRRCTLPDGWRREGSDHAMWSHVLDERGVKRVAIFYKAAFYDRDAFASITRPGYALATESVYGDGPAALPGQWSVLTEEERADFRAGLERATPDGARRARVQKLLKLAQS